MTGDQWQNLVEARERLDVALDAERGPRIANMRRDLQRGDALYARIRKAGGTDLDVAHASFLERLRLEARAVELEQRLGPPPATSARALRTRRLAGDKPSGIAHAEATETGVAHVTIPSITPEQGSDVAVFPHVVAQSASECRRGDDGLLYGEEYRRASLLAEAMNVERETGLTPRQLAEQRNDLLDVLGWYASAVVDCNRHGADGDAARDRLANDAGRRANAAIARATGDGSDARHARRLEPGNAG